MPGTDEDSASAGTTVSAIVNNAGWGDVDTGALRGLAATGSSGNGTWEYSTDGLAWTGFGSVSPTTALLLDATSQVRYVGDSQNGEVAAFNFKAWDTTAGTASSNGTPRYANPGTGGGTSAYSSETASAATTVTAVNDRPVATIVPIGYGINEDSPAVVLVGVSVSDVDAGASDIEVTLTVNDGDLTLGTDDRVDSHRRGLGKQHIHGGRLADQPEQRPGHTAISTGSALFRDGYSHPGC